MTIASRDYGPYYDDTLGDLYDEISANQVEGDIWVLLGLHAASPESS